MADPMPMARNPREDLHLLSTTGSFLHLQEIAFLIKEKYSEPVDLGQLQNITFRPHEIDSVALSILQPASVSNLKPIRTLADGNCLFNAASMALTGSAKLATELRLRTAIELILNSDYYGNHPVVTNANVPLKFQKQKNSGKCHTGTYNVEAVFMAAIFSSEACTMLNKHGFRSALEQEIKNTVRLGCFSGILQIMGLSSAIGCQIKMVYPDKRHTMYSLLNGMYSPRMPIEKNENKNCRNKTISVMWTCLQGWPNRWKEFNVNHFVLLTNTSPQYNWATVSRKSEKNPGKENTAKRPSTPSTVPRTKHTKSSENSQARQARPTEAYNQLKPACTQRSETVEQKTEQNRGYSQASETLSRSKTQQKKMYTSSVPRKPTKTAINSQNVEPAKINCHSNVKLTKVYRRKVESLKTTELPDQKIRNSHNYSVGITSTTKRTIASKKHNQSPSKKAKRIIQSSLRHHVTNTRPVSNDLPKTNFRTFNKQTECESQNDLGTQGVRHSNISEIATLTSRPKSQEAKLKNVSRISNNVPLSFTSHTFHNDKTLSPTSILEASACTPDNANNSLKLGKAEELHVDTSCTGSNTCEVSNLINLPLATSMRWYTNQGELANANKKRTERRKTIDKTNAIIDDGEIVSFHRSQSQTGSLQENIKSLEELIKHCKNEKQQRHLAAILEVAKYLNTKFPILKTQDASILLKSERTKETNESSIDGCPKITRTTSSEIYDKLARYLNIVHVYIKGTGFIMENKDTSPLMHFLDSITTVMDRNNTKTKLNRHVENEIGDVYRTALDYMDSERDRNTLKFLLTKITSINFMTRLQDTRNKKALQTCRDLVPKQLSEFENLRKQLSEELQERKLSPRQEKQFLRRKLQIEKFRQIRSRRNINTGAKLKIEEFPDLVTILEYEFGDGDNIKRGGGGLESHSKLHNDILYRAADNKTKMKDAREAILAVAPEDFSISLSACFNYTQNYRKGTYEARRHHEGKGINACVSLHKAPDTAPIKDVVINVHWSSANVNFILDQASKNTDSYCVDSRDAKAVIRPNIGFGGKTWKNISNPDHTYDTSRTNAVTPMTHLFVQTIETARTVKLNTDDNVQEFFMTTLPRKEVVIHLKRSGRAVTILNFSYYEPETAIRSVNELLYLMTLPSLDSFFRNPSTGRLKDVLVSVVDNGVGMPRSPIVKMLLVRLRRLLGIERIIQVAFAEYHSKRNPVERVHAQHTKQLEKHGPFHFNTALHPNTNEHVDSLNKLRDDIREELNMASFGGTHTLVINGIGDEENFVFNDSKNLEEFLRMNEEAKQNCEMQYFPNVNSNIFQELVDTWGIDPDFTGLYADDYDILCDNHDGKNRMAWTDKYTTVIFNENPLVENIWEQPLPDYVRWYLTGGEYHYMTFEQRRELEYGPWDNIRELFLPSRLLDMAYLSEPFMSDNYIKQLSRLCWCPDTEIRLYLQNKKVEAETDYAETMHRAKWQKHKLYNNTKETLEKMCTKNNLDSNAGTKSKLVEKLVNKLCLEKPPELDKYLGNLADIPSSISEIKKLPVYKLKQFLRFHNIPWTGSKDQLALRVLALRTGTTHLLFRRERQGLLDTIEIAKKLIYSQISINLIGEEFIIRERSFPTSKGRDLKLHRPRQAAGNPRQQREKDDIVGFTSIDSLLNIFRELTILINASASAVLERYDPDNKEAIKTSGTRVVVKWTGEDNMNSWQPGWYIAKILRYHQNMDEIEIEYLSEPGSIYHMSLDSSIEKGILQVAGCTKVVPDLYDAFTEIGTKVLIKWDKNETVSTGWKSGWYAATIQAFYPDEDKIDVVYRTTPNEVYSEDVTELITYGKIKLAN